MANPSVNLNHHCARIEISRNNFHSGTMITNIYNDAGNIKRAKVALRLRSAAGVLLHGPVCPIRTRFHCSLQHMMSTSVHTGQSDGNFGHDL
ncbi:hypothetical protein FPOA_01300 [Fusarium poae]|uniref:Uncharacterized protein n=1 Tax=Fusarium poae TaxID=36050 RepID=A0A1B8B3Q8_FUSPO|nr:hypothetical protein FPOA_01300 [Fusarium poae]